MKKVFFYMRNPILINCNSCLNVKLNLSHEKKILNKNCEIILNYKL